MRIRLVIPAFALAFTSAAAHAQQLDLEQLRSYPFPASLTAAATGSRIAWTFNEQGRRNVYVAEGPAFEARRLTPYDQDDGQELTSVAISRDGRHVVYVRGGEHGSNWDDAVVVNPALLPVAPRMQVWSVPFDGGTPRALGEGDNAVISPRGDRVAFERNDQVWVAPIDGSAEAQRMFTARGSSSIGQWSPDGSRLAFISGRGDHAFIGIYANDSTPITYLAPSTNRDGSPRWSPDGARIAFIRRPGGGGAPDSVLARRHNPWAIMVADAAVGTASGAATGTAMPAAREIWRAPETLRGSVPNTQGGTNLHWGAGDRIVFMSYVDGWPHLYSIPAAGGTPLLITPGDYQVEYASMSPDRRYMVFAANAGSTPGDIDRRHVVRAPIDRAAPEVLTPGTGLEWTPVVTGDGSAIAYIGATAQRPPLPMVMPAAGGAARTLAESRLPRDFPAAQLVVPRHVTWRAPDGVTVYGQIFERAGGANKPAVIYVHGGPPRQMLLGWHYSDYYSNAYAMNQYLASLGYVVLSVNYRLGIGYGHDFHQPPNAGSRGASEYQDVRAGGEYLRSLPQVDGKRIGIYGGSYGGYLTALALGRDSDLFAAGVDIHGVHNYGSPERLRSLLENRVERAPDAQRAAEVAWESSPVAAVRTWRSPVLLIHGDDDRNVRFSETVDLVQRLRAARVPFEELVIPDETHHWMLHRNAMIVNHATAEFFERVLRGR